MAVKAAKPALSKEEIVEILRQNVELYRDEPDFADYLVNLTLYLVDQAYCEQGVRAGDLPQVLEELRHAREEAARESRHRVEKPKPPEEPAPSTPKSVDEEESGASPLPGEEDLDADEPPTNRLRLSRYKPVMAAPPKDYDEERRKAEEEVEAKYRNVDTQDIEIKHKIFDSPDEDFDLTTGQVKANEIMREMFKQAEQEKAEEQAQKEDPPVEEQKEEQEFRDSDYDDSQDMSVPSMKDIMAKRGVKPSTPPDLYDEQYQEEYGQYEEDAGSGGFQPQTEEEWMQVYGKRRSDMDREEYLRRQREFNQRWSNLSKEERRVEKEKIRGFNDTNSGSDSTANELMRYYGQEHQQAEGPPCPVCGTMTAGRRQCRACGHILWEEEPQS